MPAAYTHNIFAKKVYEKCNSNIQKRISTEKSLYEVFSQSFDYFFYYNFLSFKKGNKIRMATKRFHTTKTQDFIYNIIKYMLNNDLENDTSLNSCLFGIVTHYVLDSTCHPYIFYKTGKFDKNDKTTYCYNTLHSKMEHHIDAYYCLKYYKKFIYKTKPHILLLPKVNFNNNIVECFNKVYKQTYNIDDMGNKYFKSYKQAKKIYHFIMYDKYGIKKLLYLICDYLMPRKIKYNYFSLNIKKIDYSFLNKNHELWHNPYNNKEHNESFNDLFEISINKALKIFDEIDLVLAKKKDLKYLKSIIPNISYYSGLNCQKFKKMKYLPQHHQK